MTTRRPALRTLPIEDISPTVDLAVCWRFRGNDPFRYRVPGHHLILIESGCIRAKPPGREFDAHAGDLICFRSANVNQYLVREPTVCYQVHLEFAPPPRHEATPLLGELGPWPELLALGEWFAPARRAFETLCLEVARTGVLSQLRLRTAVWELATTVTEALAQQPPARASLDEWDRLGVRLAANLRQDLPMTELARVMNLTPSHFIRQFKRRFGMSPKAFLTHARLLEAVRLMRVTNAPIKWIAFEVGFPSTQSFERLFKHHLGLRPLECRAQPLFAAAKVSAAASHPLQLNRYNLAPHIAALGPAWWKIKFMPLPPRAKGRRG